MADLHRVCSVTGKTFVISEAEQNFIAKFESLHPLLKAGDIPLPLIHPEEFHKQLQSYVTLMSLFDSTSSISGTPLITRYNPKLGYKVCTHEEFWSDEVDNTNIGQNYDFDRPFFEQWNEIMRRATMQPLVQINCENSSYVDSSSGLKNCYLCFGMGASEDCLYCLKSRYPLRNRNCVDCIGIIDCELCYSSIHCDNCYACQHCSDCINSYSCFGSQDLVGCKYCFGCVGLKHTEYAIFNTRVSQEQYESFIRKAHLGSYQSRAEYLKKCTDFQNSQSLTRSTIKNSHNASGVYLDHCNNVYNCQFGENLEDCGWATGAFGKDIWRGEVYQGELGYQSAVLSGQLGFCNSINTGSENFYSYMIWNSNNCFGCVMLKKKSYCILNKQYTKEAYNELVPRIIAHMKSTGEWGQFFPGKYAPHYYEESQAGQLEKISNPTLHQTPKAQPHTEMAIPDNIEEVVIENILNKTFFCNITGKPFQFTKQEMEFYQQQKVPPPKAHWQERLKLLMPKNFVM